jgi:hypothetical protein
MRYRASLCAAALATVLAATPSVAQVVDFGKYPKLVGQWSRTGPPNNWRQVAGPPPFTPEYQAKFDGYQAEVKAGRPGNWPSTYCIPPGMPAMMNLYNPMEVIITPETTYILISHDNDSYRRIFTDGRDWPADPERTFAGYSIGRWVDEDGDGKYDALEVETRFLKGPRAYEVSGMPFHDDNAAIIKERFYLDKADPDVLFDAITVIDHALTRPYTKLLRVVRTKDPRPSWLSEDCPENNNWLKIGDEAYFLNFDGKLMPSRKDQAPPDLSYFGPAKR